MPKGIKVMGHVGGAICQHGRDFTHARRQEWVGSDVGGAIERGLGEVDLESREEVRGGDLAEGATCQPEVFDIMSDVGVFESADNQVPDVQGQVQESESWRWHSVK